MHVRQYVFDWNGEKPQQKKNEWWQRTESDRMCLFFSIGLLVAGDELDESILHKSQIAMKLIL